MLGLVLTAGLTTASLSSTALLSDEAANTSTVTTGKVDIATTPATALFAAPNMRPGERFISPIQVLNSGDAELRYSVLSTTAAGGDALASQMRLTVRSGVTDCTTSGFTATGTVVYGPGVLGSAAGTAIIGSVAQGQQAGDRVLATGASEMLCVQMAMPPVWNSAYQGLSASLTMTFNAEQTRNNP